MVGDKIWKLTNVARDEDKTLMITSKGIGIHERHKTETGQLSPVIKVYKTGPLSKTLTSNNENCVLDNPSFFVFIVTSSVV